jgi:carbamoylphosphate synthase large subunit
MSNTTGVPSDLLRISISTGPVSPIAFVALVASSAISGSFTRSTARAFPTIPCFNFVFFSTTANDPNFVHELEKIAHKFRCDLVIPTVSEELPVLAEKWNAGLIPIVLSSLRSVHIADDKFATCGHLKFKGVSVPKYRLPSWDMDGLGWPLISKPRIGRGGRGVVLHESEATLAGLDDEYVLQEFVSSVEFAPNIYCNKGKTFAVVLKKTKLKQGIVGNALVVERVNEPEIEELAIRAAKAIGLTGPVDIDIRRRSDGTPVVLDINARFGANLVNAPEILDSALEDYIND